MNTDYFSTAKFNFAWEIPLKVCFFNTNYEIVVSADAYFSTDKVTEAQNAAYRSFLEQQKEIAGEVEKLLLKEAGSENAAIERFIPKALKIKRDGNCGFVFDDKNDFESGLVISIAPKFQAMSTDEYF